MSYGASEADRMIANTVMAGTVAAVDPGAGMVKVESDGWTTDWMPWMSVAAGQARHWRVPSVGEQAVILSPSGDPEQGFALCGFYTDALGRDGRPNVVAWLMPDGATMEYDYTSSTLSVDGTQTITITNAGDVTVKATKVTIDAPNTECTGNLTVGKSLTMGTEGGTATMTGNMKINGDIEVNGSSITHNGKEIGFEHTHGGVLPGGADTDVVN